MKRLVYEAREDPTKVQAYVDGLKAEINKVGNTLERTDTTSVETRVETLRIFSRISLSKR